MDAVRKRAIVRGRVQGVGFRVNTRERARRLGLTGSAQNLPDGTVEVEVEGTEAAVADLLAWLGNGPRWARVTGVAVEDLDPTGGTGFELR
jgi:Acylphosphatases